MGEDGGTAERNGPVATLMQGDCLVRLGELASASIDSCVTDPPYGIGFAGREWDHGVPGTEFWTQILRVLRPGAVLAAFGGTRSWHRLGCAIEDSGFEMLDTVMWLHANGLPLRERLRPSWEPVLLARRPPSEDTLAANMALHGTGTLRPAAIAEPDGRRPSNLWHDGSAEVEAAFAVYGDRKSCSSPSLARSGGAVFGGARAQGRIYPGEGGSASRFFFCPHANKADRAGSSLGDRMDAGFHMARQSLSARVAELQEAFGADEAIARLEAVNPVDKAGLRVLARFGTGHLDMAAVTREYPHLALAIVERDAAVSLSRAANAVLAAKRDLAALTGLAREPEPRRGWIYPLLDPAAYEDGVPGYDHALVLGVRREKSALFHGDVRKEADDIFHVGVIVDAEGGRHPSGEVVELYRSSIDLSAGRPHDPASEPGSEPESQPRP